MFGVRGKSEKGKVPRYIRADVVLRELRRLGVCKGKSIIDVGASEGHFASIASRELGCSVVACDVSQEACNRANEFFGLDTLCCNAVSIPVDSGKFDVAVCMETIEHIPDIRAAIQELLRVAKSVVITVPNESISKTTRSHLSIHPHAHLWKFNRNSFDYLIDYGYRVSVVRHTSMFTAAACKIFEVFNILTERIALFAVFIDRFMGKVKPSLGWVVTIRKDNP